MVAAVLYAKDHLTVVFEGRLDPNNAWPGILKYDDRYFRMANVYPNLICFVEDDVLDIKSPGLVNVQ